MIDYMAIRNLSDNDFEALAVFIAKESKRRRDDIPDKLRPHGERRRCPRGHPYDGSNLYVNPNGQRQCRTCTNLRQRKRREKKAIELLTVSMGDLE